MSDPPFHLFGPDHLAALGITLALCLWIAAAARRLPETLRRRMGQGLGLVLLAYGVAFYYVTITRTGWTWEWSLPLNICDWVLVACLLALFRRDPLAFELAYFWGLAGTLQGLLTPDLRSGFPTFRYFHFFWGHSGILVAIVWMVAAEGMRPRPGAVARMMLALNVYAVSVGALDTLFGWNYGYLRHGPAHASLLRYLGPWPWYLLSVEIIALALFTLLDLPWRAARAQQSESTLPDPAT